MSKEKTDERLLEFHAALQEIKRIIKKKTDNESVWH